MLGLNPTISGSTGKVRLSIQERNKLGNLKEQSVGKNEIQTRQRSKEITYRQKLGAERKARDRQTVGGEGAGMQYSGTWPGWLRIDFVRCSRSKLGTGR